MSMPSGMVVHSKGAVWVSSMDLQAKARNINNLMHQQNDECGCSICEARGQHV